jgi:radical SAM protein with 4Fe4S-binding SPASM domain
MQNTKFLTRIPTGMSYLLHREHNWGQPIFFTIETINTCNFRCVYCPQSDPASHFVNGQGTMSFENFKAIVANLRSAFNVGIVSLHGDGEPLLNKRLEEYIAHLTGLGVCVTVASNCSLISPDRAKRLIASGLRLMATDFCADAALYERLRVRGKWQATLDGMRNMLQAAAEAKADFRLVIKDFATQNCPPEQAGPIMEATRELFPQERDRVTVMPIYFHNALGESLVNLNESPAANPMAVYTLCHQPWVNFTVDYAGRVIGCSRDLRSEHVVGNLLEQPAAEIWNGARMRNLRHALASKRPQDINICSKCDAPWHGSYSGRTAAAKIRSFFFSRVWKR